MIILIQHRLHHEPSYRALKLLFSEFFQFVLNALFLAQGFNGEIG